MIERYFNISIIAQKLLAVTLPCLVLWLVWIAAISPILQLSDGYQDQRDDLLDRIAADQRKISLGPAWQQELVRLKGAASRNQGARTEPTQALAAAGLQDDIQTMLAQVGGQILSVQVLPSTTIGPYETISIQLSMSLPIVALPDFLKRLETHIPFMFVQAASFQAPDAMAGPGDSDVASSVNLQCTILAYRQP